MREREEVQEVLRRLKRVIAATASHTHARRFRTDRSSARKLNLIKLARGDGINRGGLHSGTGPGDARAELFGEARHAGGSTMELARESGARTALESGSASTTGTTTDMFP